MKVTPHSSHRRWNLRADARNLTQGWPIPSEGYSDQPYTVKVADGHWVCVLTTGKGQEGEAGQHVVATISRDRGQTWSGLIDIEPDDGPPASWAMPLIVPGGRIYVFYTYNDAGVEEIQLDPDFERTIALEAAARIRRRVDTLGSLVFRYSDDGGLSWSAERHHVPVREFEIDRQNGVEGRIRYFWGVGKPIVHDGRVYIGLSKVGRFGHGFLQSSEGFFMRSDNLCTEPDPAKIVWETLPQGDIGLRAPVGPIGEEHNLVGLSDGSLYCTYRTIAGYACHAYSRDGGRTWTPPAPMTERPGGRIIKNPRAANFVKRQGDGTFIHWFHFNGVPSYNNTPWEGNRNLSWLACGKEHDGPGGRVIHWSQPEIVLYDPNFLLGGSYPDFIEDGGDLFITATQKTFAFTTQVDRQLLATLKQQDTLCTVATNGLAATWTSGAGDCVLAPVEPRLCEGGGFTLELGLIWDESPQSVDLLHNTEESGRGFRVEARPGGRLRLTLQDEATGSFWDSDRGLLQSGSAHHVVIMVDGGSKAITYLIDGVLNNGGDERPFGWGRMSPNLRDINAGPLVVTTAGGKVLHRVRYYNRCLTTSEAVGNWRAATTGATA